MNEPSNYRLEAALWAAGLSPDQHRGTEPPSRPSSATVEFQSLPQGALFRTTPTGALLTKYANGYRSGFGRTVTLDGTLKVFVLAKKTIPSQGTP